jgi:signal peptidase II
VSRFFYSALIVLALDQVTKFLIRAQMDFREVLPVMGEFFRFHYVHNSGAAFGLFSHSGSRYYFIAISLISIAVILYLILSGRYEFRGSRIAFGLVLGGAVGNLVDRIWLKEVIDFIDMGFGAHRWPTYNIADVGVTLGVLYLAATFITTEWEGSRKPESIAPAATASTSTNSEPSDV